MTRKTYKTRTLRGLTLDIYINGERREIIFAGGYQFDSTSIYVTSDEDEQKALESLSLFNRDYYLYEEENIEEAPKEVVIEEEPVEEIVAKDMLDSGVFKNLVGMKNAMIEKGLDVSKCHSYIECRALARDNGYDYKVEK